MQKQTLLWQNFHLRSKEVNFLGRNKTTKDVTTQKQKITKFLGKVKFPPSKKALQPHNCFLNYNRNYLPRLAETLNPFFQLPKTTENKEKLITTTELMNEIRDIKDAVDRSCHLALRQPLPNS